MALDEHGGTPANNPPRKNGGHPAAGWSIAPEPVDSAAAAALWRTCYTEVSDRRHVTAEGHRTEPSELECEISADAGDGLHPSQGLLLVGRYGGEPAGQAGIRLIDSNTTELKRVYLRTDARGSGGAKLLVAAAEEAAHALGATRIVLDTRSDLKEADTLYERLGYTATEPHNAEPNADLWFAKSLV